MPKIQNEERAQKNLKRWLRTYRLPDYFPRFQIEPGQDHVIFERNDGEEIRSMYNDMIGSPRTLISFAPGQGATTSLKSIIKNANKAEYKVQQIFVEISPINFDEIDMDEDFLSEIRGQVAESLLFDDWENRFHDNKLTSLYSILNVKDRNELDDKRREIENQTNGDAEKIKEKCAELMPHYMEREADLLVDIYNQLGLTVVMMYDIPDAIDDDMVGDMVGHIKWFNDRMKTRDGPVAAIVDVFFAARKHIRYLEDSWARAFLRIDIESFSEQEVWLVLASRFSPRSSSKYVELSNIFSEDFVSKVYSAEKPFAQMMDEIQHEMLLALDIDEHNIPPKLYPRG